MKSRNVSVIIPSYNRSHILEITIPSYLQDITLEIIIVDDGSTDRTKNTVKRLHEKFSNIRYIRLKEHKGLPYAKNIGVRKAKGTYIFFGDDDAVLYPGTLHRLRDAIENFPADIAGANGSYASEMRQIINMDDYIDSYFTEPFNTDCIADFNTGAFKLNYHIDRITEGLFVMSCFMIKSEMARDIKYDKRFIGNAAREDMDYLVQQSRKGRKMVYVPDAYEIDLPSEYVNGGGSHDMKIWKYVMYAIINNNYFIDKNYDFLKKGGYITVSKFEAKWYFCFQHIKGLIQMYKSMLLQIGKNFF